MAELDLRGTDPTQALKLLDELWETRGAGTGRVLVTDESRLLMPHAAVFARLRTPLVGALLCVAVGRPGGATGLEVPGPLLAGQDAGLLWVPDEAGHGWRPDGPALIAGPDVPGGGLARLRELLRLPEVFDRTAVLAAAVPGGVSNPGMRLAAGLPDDAEFASALLTAISELLEPDARPAVPPLEEGEGEPEETTVRVRDGSPLKAAGERAEAAVAGAHTAAERLGGPSSLLLFRRPLPAVGEIAHAGQAVAELPTHWGTLFAEVPADIEPFPGQHRLLREKGVLLPEPEKPDREQVRMAFGGYVAEALTRGSSLAGLKEGLREQQQRVVPPRLDAERELDRACPAEVLDRLRGDARLPRSQAWLPLPGLAVTLLAGLGPFGVAGAAAFGVIYVLLIGLSLVRGPGDGLRDERAPMMETVAACVLGCFLVGAVGPVDLSPALRLASVLLAGGGALATTLWSWRSRCRRWVRATGLEEVPAVLAELDATALRLAAGWVRAARGRAGVADLVRAAAAVAGVRDALAWHAETRPAADGRTGARVELVASVRRHLRGLVEAALEPCWGDPADDLPTVHQERACTATADRLTEWERRASLHGALEPPPSASDASLRMEEADAGALANEVAHRPDGVMWQLLGPGELALTRDGDRHPPCVRFAPEATRAALAARCPADTLWIRSSRHAGVLRLVPVRPDAVRQSWTSDGDSWETT